MLLRAATRSDPLSLPCCRCGCPGGTQTGARRAAGTAGRAGCPRRRAERAALSGSSRDLRDPGRTPGGPPRPPKSMFAGKFRSWMEAHLGRPKKNKQPKEKKGGAKEAPPAPGADGQTTLADLPASSHLHRGPLTAESLDSISTCPTTGSERGGLRPHVNLSSPESAYSTGYSTDGTSPGASFPPEYYINLRTGTHYFHGPTPVPLPLPHPGPLALGPPPGLPAGLPPGLPPLPPALQPALQALHLRQSWVSDTSVTPPERTTDSRVSQ
ncbi:Sister chromatid cohesion protein PDS5-like protein A-A [Frankliniella fusca]|uniref:Sister chromatid cohesion protein PDS5-like protein A-A n=1 Tax=Frankliniella fusca TaxID=407009 RepID=A0AAE1LTS1_9NEOP|nr:Sister chromatid cohesion protein PDS5-like protein A-A [Frankliniella fusca]